MRNRFHPLRILVLSSLAFCFAALISPSTELLSATNLAPTEQTREQTNDVLYTTKTDNDSNNEPKNKLIGSPAWQRWLDLPTHLKAKVDPRLIAELSGQILPAHLGGTAENHLVPPSDQRAIEHTRFVVNMAAQVNLSHELSQQVYASSLQQRSAALDVLNRHAQSSQAALRSSLEDRMSSSDVIGYHSFFIVNAMAVEGNLDTIIALAKRSDVERVQASYPLVPLWDTDEFARQVQQIEEDAAKAASAPDTVDALDDANWNIDLVDADRVWSNFGIRGEGAVVAGFDTGVEFTHPALNQNYRGTIGDGEYNHNYSWFAPDSKLYPDGNLGASLSNQPSDCNYYSTHGTHTMGTMVGRHDSTINSGGTDIGMAPNARWIAVPGICNGTMPGNLSDDIGGLKAFQWLLCPTDLTGDLATADCSKAPDVVNNSWGSANPVNDILHPAVEALRAAGIAPVFASGNPRAGEGSIGTPGNSPDAITVGATDRDDEIADFSGRGPSFYENELKPELTAPGVRIRSSVGNSYYDSYSGTSMAAPHVAGLIALMVSADLQDGVRDFDVDELERFMTYTAVDLGPPGHDNEFGHGRIDAYSAVSWVKSAGDLRGTIRDATTNFPIADATVSGNLNGQSFTIQSGSTGVYSITVPAGSYNINVDAWGYRSKQFSGQTVFPASLSFADFQLEAEPQATLQGLLTTGAAWPGHPSSNADGAIRGAPIADAQIVVVGSSQITATTDAGGAFSMSLPSGTHELRLSAASHRTITTTVEISTSVNLSEVVAAPPTLNVSMDAAPKLLVVDADASGGWFTGWPVYPVFEYALNKAGYPYELWRIEHLDVVDVSTTVEGFEKRGIPSLETLQQYDTIIWAHSGCGDFYCFVGGTPKNMGAEKLLTDYLDGGGRLILSGQNVSAWASRESELMTYLGSQHIDNFGGSEGEFLTGSEFLDELSLEVTNATLYGFRNGILYLSPDAVRPRQEDAISQPVLKYPDGNSAALAVSPCAADYRTVFYAAGYENLGPRNGDLVPDAVEAMDRSIQWLAQAKSDYALSLNTDFVEQSETQGETLWYEVDIANSGLQPLLISFNLSSAQWNTTLYTGTVSLNEAAGDDSGGEAIRNPIGAGEQFLIQPCASQQFSVEVEVPENAKNGDKDIATIEVLTDAPITEQTGSAEGPVDLIKRVDLTSVAFTSWESQASMPTNRYRLAVESLPGDTFVYAIGGWDGDAFEITSINERYNACTDEWSTLASMPQPAAAPGSAVLNGKLYVTGGLRISYDTYSFNAQDNVYIYDPATDVWTAGPALPVPMYGHAMAAHEGTLYIFGGQDSQTEFDTAYALDPNSDEWREIAAVPGGSRAYGAAAVLNDRIYYVGGWPATETVEVYDPASDEWSTAANLNFGRQSPGVETAPDGYIYVSGGGNGWDGIEEVERYNADADDWEIISPLSPLSRVGSGLAYSAGKLHSLGGLYGSRSNEGLQIDSAFCLSDKQVKTPVAQPGSSIRYRVDISGDSSAVSNIQVLDTIPVSTTFAGFEANDIGAVYNQEADRIEWLGDIPAGSAGLAYTYTVALDDVPWPSGTEISSTTRFEGQIALDSLPVAASESITPTTQIFTRTTRSRVFVADFAPSSIAASADSVIEGEILTYTVSLKSSNAAGGPVTVSGTLPTGMTLVDGSIQWPAESVTMDVGETGYVVSGIVGNDDTAYVNSSDSYGWNDSDGETSFGKSGVKASYEWIDIVEDGQQVLSGDDQYLCDQPIGFTFPYYGQSYSEFCVSTNGFISFDRAGYSNLLNECPLPSFFGNRSTIAAMWDDLVTEAIYIQTIGEAPSRALVVQFVDVRQYAAFGNELAAFEIILYETGEIKIQFLTIDDSMGASSTTGLTNEDNTVGVTYACNVAESLEAEMAIWFTPPGGSIGNAASQLSFAVNVEDGLPVNSIISNTVQISDTFSTYTRTVETKLNPVGLAAISEVVGGAQINVGGQIAYLFTIENSGRLTATDVSFVFPFVEETTYQPDSISCSSGTCSATATQAEWRGSIAGRETVTVRFNAELSAPVPNNTPVVGVATLDDGFGTESQIPVYVYSRSSDLGNSLITVESQFAELGENALVDIVLRNTGSVETESRATITLPPDLAILEETVVCGVGQCDHVDGTVTWQGTLPPRSAIPIRFLVQTPADGAYGEAYTYDVTITDLNRQELTELTGQVISARITYYPVSFAPSAIKELFVPIAPFIAPVTSGR